MGSDEDRQRFLLFNLNNRTNSYYYSYKEHIRTRIPISHRLSPCVLEWNKNTISTKHFRFDSNRNCICIQCWKCLQDANFFFQELLQKRVPQAGRGSKTTVPVSREKWLEEKEETRQGRYEYIVTLFINWDEKDICEIIA